MASEAPMTTNPTPLPPEGVTATQADRDALKAAWNEYACYMGDPDGKDDIETAFEEAAKIIARHRIAATSAAEGEVEADGWHHQRNHIPIIQSIVADALDSMVSDTDQKSRDAAECILSYVNQHITPAATKAEAANARLKEFISDQATLAEMRIKNGMDLGATVWRIALEDFTRESRAILDRLDQGAEE